MTAGPDRPAFVERAGWGGAGWIVASILLFSVVLGVHFGRQYVTFMVHVRDTLHEPEEPHAWEVAPVMPEGCVDEAMRWARECTGIKTLCDMYVNYVMERCLSSRDRVTYCAELRGRHTTTEFGVRECQARGVRRHLDDLSCSNAYRQIDTHCTRVLLEATEGERTEELP